MKSNKDSCIAAVLAAEGGYVNDPRDPGGETIFGITRRDHPDLWAKGRPTVEQAKERYDRDYWQPAFCDVWPAPIDGFVFSAAVNIGPVPAVRIAQDVLGVAADGRVGPITINAAKAVNSNWFAMRYALRWLKYYSTLSTYRVYGDGWYNRIAAEIDRTMKG